MGQNTRFKAAGRSLPGSHGLFLVTAHGLPVQRGLGTAPFQGQFPPKGLRLVPDTYFRQRRQRSFMERIRRAVRAFWN